MDLHQPRNADLNAAQDQFVGTQRANQESGFALARLHETAGHLAHVVSGAGELAAQEVGLDSHRFLKVGGMNQLARMLEG